MAAPRRGSWRVPRCPGQSSRMRPSSGRRPPKYDPAARSMVRPDGGPSVMPGSAAVSTRAAAAATAMDTARASSFGPMGTASCATIGPASAAPPCSAGWPGLGFPIGNCPVDGRAPPYRGSSEPCILSAPQRASCSSCGGNKSGIESENIVRCDTANLPKPFGRRGLSWRHDTHAVRGCEVGDGAEPAPFAA